MPDSDPVAERVVLEFLRRYAEDARCGQSLGLEHYQALYPGYEARLAAEWETLQADASEEAADASSARRLGPYRLFEVLGQGGQGVVHRAVDERIGRTVALKLLSGVAPEGGLPARVQREVEAIARLDHPGLGVVYEGGVLDGQVYLAMRYVPGRSLDELIAERGGVSSRQDSLTRRERLRADVELVEKIARALHTAHESGVVHRDVKPANVMIHESGEPVLLDFGLARADDSSLATLTLSGELLGTTAYMAPERLRGDGQLDRRVDVWALGVLLYELLTGQRPFDGPGLDEVSRRIRLEEPTDPRHLEPSIPRDLAVVLGAALEKNPGRRYSSALAFAEELARVRAGRPVLARPPGSLGRLRRWGMRHPALAGLGLVLLASAVASVWAALAFADLAGAERQARRQAEALLVHRAAEQAELLQLSARPGRRWQMLEVLSAAARTRAELERPLPDDLPDLPRLRELATQALLSVDARHDRVIQRSSLGAGRFTRDGSRLATTWVASDFSRAGLRVLDTADGAELIRMDGMFLMSDSFSVAFEPHASALLVPRSDAISLWRSADAAHLQQYAIPDALEAASTTSRWELTILPGEEYFVAVGAPGKDPARPHGWAIWELDTARLVRHQVAEPDLNDWLALSPDGRRLLLPTGARSSQLLGLPIGAGRGAHRVHELLLTELEAPAPVRAALLGDGPNPELVWLLRPPGSAVDELVRMRVDGQILARRALPLRTSIECGLLRRSPDGRHLALASDGGELLLLDARTLEVVLRIPPASTRRIEDLRFAAGGRELLSHSPGQGSDAWELQLDPGLERRLSLRPQSQHAVAASADGRWLGALVEGERAPRRMRVTADEDPPAEAPRLTLPEQAAPLEHLALDAQGARVTAAGGGEVWLWELPEAAPRRLEVALAAGETITGLGFDDAGSLRLRLQSAGAPERVLDFLGETVAALDPTPLPHWLTPDPQLRRALLVPQEGVRAPSTLARGELLWRDAEEAAPRALPGVPVDAFRQVFGARFAADAERLAAVVYLPRDDPAAGSGLPDCQVMCWDLSDDTLLWSHAVDARLLSIAPAISADGRLVVVAEPGGRALLLDGLAGEPLLRWRACDADQGLVELQLLGDGERLLSRTTDGELKLTELAELRRQLDALGLGF